MYELRQFWDSAKEWAADNPILFIGIGLVIVAVKILTMPHRVS